MKFNSDEKAQLLGMIIDIFEDFLEAHGVDLHNPEKNEDSTDISAIIYGTDYDRLAGELEALLENYGIL